MEVACGEYGDMVPSLVVAVKAYKCEQFQALQKFTNCGKNLADQWRHQEVVGVKETPILDDNISEAEDAPLNCNGARSNKVIASSQNGKCGVTMCHQVTRPSVILTFCRSLCLSQARLLDSKEYVCPRYNANSVITGIRLYLVKFL